MVIYWTETLTCSDTLQLCNNNGLSYFYVIVVNVHRWSTLKITRFRSQSSVACKKIYHFHIQHCGHYMPPLHRNLTVTIPAKRVCQIFDLKKKVMTKKVVVLTRWDPGKFNKIELVSFFKIIFLFGKKLTSLIRTKNL